ncbi:MAG: XrtA/PEP-CTERM system histidine kinase PrsK [Pseudomonadota bacterium]
MSELTVASYGISALAFAVLFLLVVSIWRDRYQSTALALAAVFSLAWALAIVGQAKGLPISSQIIALLEFMRMASWHWLLVLLLTAMKAPAWISRATLTLWAAFLAVVLIVVAAKQLDLLSVELGGWVQLSGLLGATGGLILLEQIFRNTPASRRWAVKYLCFGLGGIFAYDLVLFVRAYLDGTIDLQAWNGRGFVNALMVLALALSVKRNPVWRFDDYLSREVVFYSAAFTGIGLYLMAMAAGAYYIQSFGSTWGDIGRAIFLAAGGLGLAMLVFSESVRARTRIFLNKNFFRYKYDYRAEWLRFISTLSYGEADDVPPTAIKAVAQIVGSPGGRMWLSSESQPCFVHVGVWGESGPDVPELPSSEPLIQFMAEKEWIIDLAQLHDDPAFYLPVDKAPAVFEDSNWWLLVPLFLSKQLYGFIALRSPDERQMLNFEDHDLLRTVGRHIATHVQQIEADRRLAQNRQFDAYNRLTAFIMHDISNLIAQQSMVVSNAQKHKNNPAFIEDAIKTIENSVDRMNRLMAQLRSGRLADKRRRTRLSEVVEAAVQRCQIREPKASLGALETDLFVDCDSEHLTMILEHLIRNGQDATDNKGEVRAELALASGIAVITIADTGAGMSPSFVSERLFKPFDSTKGAKGMGIGAFQARNYVRQLGGDLEVDSTLGAGTRISLLLPKSAG